MELLLKNNVTKKEISVGVTDISDSNLFYHFEMNLPSGMDDGEYTYILKRGDKELTRGLCQIGDYTPEKTNYITEDNGYKQYDPL